MITITRTKKPKKKPRFSKWIVSIIILMNIAFAMGALYVFFRIGSEPITLISCWFGFTTVELWQLAVIKKTKSTVNQTVEFARDTEEMGDI